MTERARTSPKGTPSPLELAERGERRQKVWEALRSLAVEDRAVLMLREMEGLAYDAIAERLEIPMGTVLSCLHRARTRLRDRLTAALGETA